MKNFFTIIAIAAFALAMPACKGKVSDAEIKTAAEAAIQANPVLAGIAVDVANGVATLSGTVTADAVKLAADSTVSLIKGINSVTNNIVVAPPIISNDEQLQTAIIDAIKDHPTVQAAVKDSVVTLTGEIKKADLATLMQKVQASRPKKVVSDGLIKK
jgi:osmotically-inducible protein OsmY